MDTPDDTVLPASALGNPFLFTGREYDAETGLYYYRARYLDPRTGTFLQEDAYPKPTSRLDVFLLSGLIPRIDPRAFAIAQKQPLRLHRYLYAMGNPVKLVDPFGKPPTTAPTGLTALSAMARVTRLPFISVAQGGVAAMSIDGPSVIGPGGTLPIACPPLPQTPADEPTPQESKDCARICRHLEDDPVAWFECIKAWTELVLGG
jgi:RHS repeat-associated protein